MSVPRQVERLRNNLSLFHLDTTLTNRNNLFTASIRLQLDFELEEGPSGQETSQGVVPGNGSQQKVLHFALHFTSELEYKCGSSAGNDRKEQSLTNLSIF